jgi:uncharacterized protein (TIGR03546 family)
MTLLLKQFFQLLKLLNSETGTYQIAWGVAFGFVLGMTPAFSLQTILVFIILLFFRVQMGAAFVAAFFFKFIAFLLDPIFHSIGAAVLSNEGLKPLLTSLYNMPIVPWTRFYNTIVMGSGVVSLLLTPLVFYISLYLVKKYRKNVYERFKQSKFFKAIQATSFYKWYVKYDEYYGA